MIAYAGGAAGETIPGLDSPAPTGVLFNEQSVDAIVAAIVQFEQQEFRFDAEACRANAQRFAADRFRAQFADFVATRTGGGEVVAMR